MKPLTGAPWPMVISNLVAGGIMLVAVFGYGALNHLELAPDWGWLPLLLIGGAIAIVLGGRACRAFLVRRFKAELTKRGVPNPLASEIEFSNVGVSVKIGVFEQRFPWSAVSEVLKIGPYWILIAQATPIYIPARMIEPIGEGAFLTELRRSLSADVLARSRPSLTASN